MSDLESQFDSAAEAVKELKKQPSNDDLLQLYALFKQGRHGDVSGSRPGFTNPVGRAKYDAWAKLKGVGRDDAMQRYVDVVAKLRAAQGL